MNQSVLRRQALLDALESRIVVIDGSMGALLQQRCTIEDYGGSQYENSPEMVLMTRPDIIAGVHRSYLEAGAEIIETDTFNATPVGMADFGLDGRVTEINHAAARVARELADEFTTSTGKQRWVAGSMGPTTKSISLTGGVTFTELTSKPRR